MVGPCGFFWAMVPKDHLGLSFSSISWLWILIFWAKLRQKFQQAITLQGATYLVYTRDEGTPEVGQHDLCFLSRFTGSLRLVPTIIVHI